MAETLAGITVVVTRPAHQAQPLCQLIEANGGTILRFPVLEIAGPRDATVVTETVRHLAEFDIAIFISPNAVQWGMKFVAASGGFPLGIQVAAVGRGSARELAKNGIEPDIFPSQQYNSEALLAMHQMQQVAGKRIIIFRGESGRELLADSLRERGAVVEYVECYRRVQPDIDPAPLVESLNRDKVDIITVTSNEGLQNLVNMVSDSARSKLMALPLIVVSERSQILASELGFQGPVIVSKQPSDEALLNAIIDWHTDSGQIR